MQFTPQQITQFQTEGDLAIPDFWDAEEVAAMQAELDRLKDAGKLRNVATEGDGITHSQKASNLQICPLYPHSDFFRALPFSDKVIAAISQLIGDPVIWHLDQIFLKPGQHGAGTNWHQDNAYFKIPDPLKGTAMWTAIHEATVANGTIRVIPRSFHQVYEHTRDPQSDHHLRCYPPEDEALPIELPAGGVAFFAYGVAHATGGNTTARERAGLALHFINGAMDGEAASGFEVGKRPVLTGPEATDGVREFGVPVAGTWRKEVVRVLSTPV